MEQGKERKKAGRKKETFEKGEPSTYGKGLRWQEGK